MKKTFIKRVKTAAAVVLTAALLLLLPPFSMTAYAGVLKEGSCGSGLSFKLTSDGVLAITGVGSMDNYLTNGAPWHDYRYQIKSIVVETGATSIGEYAFFGCTGCTSISLPQTVTKIGKRAFSDCSSIETLLLPALLTSIGDHAFYKCSKLQAIIVPYKVSKISEYAFCDCKALKTVSFGILSEVTNLTSIDAHAFENCSSLLAISIPKNVKTIGESCFYNCSMLQSFTGSAALTSLGDNCFYNCKALAKAVIKGSVKKIPDNCFQSCSLLSRVDLPGSVTQIGNSAFSGCTKLADVYFDNIEDVWKNNVTIGYTNDPLKKAKMHFLPGGKCGKNLVWALSYDGDLTITGTGDMYDYEYQTAPWYKDRSYLAHITINEGATSIGNFAFDYCEKVESVKIPSTVKKIGNRAFYNCKLLAGLTLPSGLSSMGEFAFYGCKKLTSVKIPSSLKEIPFYSFAYCDMLSEVTLHSSLVTIGGGAFENDKALKKVSLPSSLKTIDQYAFNDTGLTEVDIPSGVTTLGRDCFEDCHDLKNIYISGTVTELPPYFARRCEKLNYITIPSSVTKIGYAAFDGCAALASGTVNYKDIQPNWNKITIEKLNDPLLSAKKTYVPGGWCGSKLIWKKDGTILTITGTGAMYDWTESSPAPWDNYKGYINYIRIGEGATTIGNYAFKDCKNVKNITLPSTLTKSGKYAFDGCKSMAAVFAASMSSWCNIYFINEQAHPFCAVTGGTLYIKEGAYNVAVGDITVPSGRTKLQQYSFYKCNTLKTVTIPSGYKTISYQVFNYSGLKEIHIPSSVTEINNYAFDNCTWLKDVYYDGYEYDWNKIKIGVHNDPLLKATKHFKQPHDINGDGATDNRDLIRLMKYLSGQTIYVKYAEVDVNRDGKTDSRDLVHLMNQLSA